MMVRPWSPGRECFAGEFELADGGVAQGLGGRGVELDVVGGPPGAELFAAGRELTDQAGQAAVVGVAACFDAQGGDAVAGDDVPLGVEVAGTRVEEEVAGKVEAGGALCVDVGEQSPAGPVGGEDVHAVVADVGGGTDAVEDAQHTLPRAGWAGGAARPAQPLDAAPAAVERDPRLAGGEPVPAAGEEVADLVPVVHAFDRTTRARR